jgi:adenylate cyclase
MSATPESSLADPEQLTADLQRQLAECKAERDAALAREAATAEVLKLISNSAFDLQAVLDTLTASAARLCEAEMAFLSRREDDSFRFVTAVGSAPEAVDDAKRLLASLNARPFVAGRGTIAGRVVLEGQAIQIADIANDPEYMLAEATTVGRIRTLLGMPLLRDREPVGTLTLARQRVEPFTEKQIALVATFADQAVIAIENARLFDAVQQRSRDLTESLEQQTATAEVLKVISRSAFDLQPALETLIGSAVRLCNASRGEVFLRDGDLFHIRANAGRHPPGLLDFLRRNPIKTGRQTVTGRAAITGEVQNIADILADTEYEFPGVMEHHALRSRLGVPLMRDGRVEGVLHLSREESQPFTSRQVELVTTFADQAVVAVENARLFGAVQQRTRELTESLEQQTATAEVLQVINSSRGELKPVFDAMLEKAIRVCDAEAGVLCTYDGEFFSPVAHRGVDDFPRDPIRSHPETGAGRLARGEDVVQILDSASGAPVDAGDPGRLALLKWGGIRTQVAAALRTDRGLIGSFTIWRRQVCPFSDKQMALLQNFAAQAVIAMENARLLGELRQRTNEVAELNRGLEAQVAEQVEELGRVGRLKRFLAPQLAELIVSQGNEQILESHRREIVVVFCDLRGYTAFTETAEPEEVLDFLREYHGALGPLVSQFEGTLDQFSGDGIMVFFNDPVPVPDPAERAVTMAVAMREAAGALIAKWRRRGRELGFGAGIAQGYATLGQIGFAERSGYTAIGTVCNLAARLCAEAKDGQILVAQRVAVAFEETTVFEQLGALTLKGLSQPVIAFNVPLAGNQAAFRVIEGGAPNGSP